MLRNIVKPLLSNIAKSIFSNKYNFSQVNSNIDTIFALSSGLNTAISVHNIKFLDRAHLRPPLLKSAILSPPPKSKVPPQINLEKSSATHVPYNSLVFTPHKKP